MHSIINSLKRVLLIAGDAVVFYLALWLSINLRYQFLVDSYLWKQHLISFSILYIFWMAIFFITNLYDLNVARNDEYFYSVLFRALAIITAFSIVFFYLNPYFNIAPKTNLFLQLGFFTVAFVLWRNLFNFLVKTPSLQTNVLILGKNKETGELIKYLDKNPQLGYYPKRHLDQQEVQLIFDLIETLVKDNIQVVVTSLAQRDGALVKNLYQCLPLKIVLIDLPTFYEKITGKIPVSAIEEMWFLENLMKNDRSLYEVFKRVVDIIYAITMGLVTLPLYPLVALAIKLDSAGPVFYKQSRVGQDSKIFTLFKLRSMVRDAEKNGAQWTIENDKRITRIGNFLRKTRIDELPQLWNVLIGDMSFIGPRPERPEIAFGKNLPDQIPFYQIRHLIKPGLTGWAQINYHYGASIEDAFEKLQYDLYYLKNRSLALDLAIMLKTIKIVLSREGR